jgi:oligopeptide/dipeptide ABC transporter ATP-binding protein
MPPLIELSGVGKSYGGQLFGRRKRPALHPMTLAMSQERPPVIAVVGESGSGKTTLGNILLGLLEPDIGAMRWCGRDPRDFSHAERQVFRREVQAITQDPFSAYNPFYPVDHALTVPIRRFGLARNRTQARELASQACTEVGLNPQDTLGRYPHQLSGGQRQRLMVARALLMRPRLLVADEPVSMVDASLRATILANIVGLNRVHGIAIVYITHDITTAYHVADEVLVLFRGHVVERGDAAAVIGDPQHPYTRLLVASIPWPDLDRRWGAGADGVLSDDGGDPAETAAGCPFAARCPGVMAVCRTTPPATIARGAHTVACHRLDTLAQQEG